MTTEQTKELPITDILNEVFNTVDFVGDVNWENMTNRVRALEEAQMKVIDKLEKQCLAEAIASVKAKESDRKRIVGILEEYSKIDDRNMTPTEYTLQAIRRDLFNDVIERITSDNQ